MLLTYSVVLFKGVSLGPLCFLIYINDLVALLAQYGVKIKLFADDVKLHVKIVNKVNCDKLHQALSALYAWAADWQLGVSIDKCCVMCIGKGTDQFHTVAFNLLFCLHVAIWVLQSEMTFHLVIILLI